MNIALFTDSFLPIRDGVVSSILAYRQGLSSYGHKMFIFAPQLEGAKKEPNVFRFASLPFPPYPEYRAAIFPHVSSSYAKKLQIDLVHCKAMTTMALSAVWFSKRAKLPAMASVETMIPEGMHYLIPIKQAEGIGKAAIWAYLRFLYSNFRLVTAPSLHSCKILKEHGIDAILLPSPVDTERFKPRRSSVKKELGLEKKKVVLSVGRIVKEKNYDILLEVAKLLEKEEVVFLLVGKGPYLEEFRHKVAARGLSSCIRFAGFVPDERLVDFYNASDVFVFPSTFETQGLTLLEALACGKPACILKGTPMQEIMVEGKTGFSFASAPECAEAILKCILQSSKMADACRKKALEYSIPACTAKLLEIYGKLLSS
ncbi:MAG: glycosyltransferase [Candidatus Micrarchaeota archaeon]|nr:glycosyltransferase [Candidatus Micrarchaeota archaeon]